jgi:hypothetical protein
MKGTFAAAVLIVAALNMPAYAEAAPTGTATANQTRRQEELRSAHCTRAATLQPRGHL